MLRILAYLLVVTLTMCSCRERVTSDRTREETTNTYEARIESRDVSNEIAGNAYLNHATEYFVIYDKDTSQFCPLFKQHDSGAVGLDLNLSYTANAETYEQRMAELISILPEATLSYNPENITDIFIGRLILTGDLAIDITRTLSIQYQTTLAIAPGSYSVLEEDLLRSRLVADLDHILKPYSLHVAGVNIEKAMWASREELLSYSRISLDSLQIPDKVFDCIVSVTVASTKDE